MDLDAAADELYGGSPEAFVERRKALVGEARRAKDRELARQIGELRRPTRTAWLVNLLARESAAEVGSLLALGADLEDAQQRRDGPELRRLSAERRKTVDRLARAAVALGADHGYTAPDSALQEVSQSLQSALADETARDQLRRGRLAAAVSYGGFGPTDLMAALAASMPTPTRAEPVEEPRPEPVEGQHPEPLELPHPEPVEGPHPEPVEPPRPEPVEGPHPEPVEGPSTSSGSGEQAALSALAEAEREAEEATARADELADRIEELRAELAETEEAEVAARTQARAARRHLQEQRRSAAAGVTG